MLITYKDLINHHKTLNIDKDGNKKSQNQIFKNHLSTLVSYLAYNGKTVDSNVGVEMLADFDKRSRKYLEQLQLAPRTISDRRSHLRAWEVSVHFLRSNGEAMRAQKRQNKITDFTQALRNAVASQDQAPKAIARKAGASTSAIARWLKGALPNERALPSLTRIEHALGLKRNELRDLLPPSRLPDCIKAPTSQTIPYRARHKALTQDRFALDEADLSPDFMHEWREFFRYKTAVHTRLKRSRRSVWRCLPKAKLATQLCAAALSGDFGCVTADMTFGQVRRYLGFLCKPASEGGMGLRPEEVMTLAWLAVPEAVNSYLEFMTRRSAGVIHRGQKNFASLVCSLTTRDHGYLYQQPRFAQRLPAHFSSSSFETMCDETYFLAREWKDKATGMSRNPEEPIRALLALSEPLTPVFRAIQSLDEQAASAAPGSRDEAVHKRNALLLSMLVANPLRRRNYVLMSYAEDGSGNLYQRQDGWRLRFEASDFKNERGAANKAYDAPLPRDISARIEEYLEEFRPRLLKNNPSALWVFPSRTGTLWENISKQVEDLTRRLIPETPGFSPHALRHLVPTDYLRKHPNDFPTVALLLHDRLETVMTNYAHLRQDDSFGRWEEHMQKVPRK
ncbi:site-specific integrase [Paraburkholderia sprentiae WSM5005]|uniref:Site-specific integrase n=1 Tax=Paraburkholderia sprentiae WSM5005 TaxID=754502 RepID=A0A1I9YCP7_9BURK|nr:site-specific integrase [Paraburkholderia sprentiae]APA84080.1 site-specific integrase [Paraburkholderia sprentiae WSM5005]